MTEVQHNNIDQINMYLGYFAEEENTDGDNPPIVESATDQMNSQLFIRNYQLDLPNRDELRRKPELTMWVVEEGE